MLKALRAINTFLGTLLVLVVLGGIGFGAWYAYQTFAKKGDIEEQLRQREAEIANLNENLRKKQQEIEQLNTKLRLHKVDHRLAQLEVLSQGPNREGKIETTFKFVEVDDQGHQLDEPRVLTVPGEEIHVESLVVTWEDNLIEAAEPFRATALCLFRRIYGEGQPPEKGYKIDVDSLPSGYRTGKSVSDFEAEIWRNFWTYANDPGKQKAAGIRNASGKSVVQKVVAGKRYRIMLRSTGEYWLKPEEALSKTTEGAF